MPLRIPVHEADAGRDDGPFCSYCRYGNIPLRTLGGRKICDFCIDRRLEDDYAQAQEHAQRIRDAREGFE